MNDSDTGLYKWLSDIVHLMCGTAHTSLTQFQDRFGFCFVSGVPPTPEATEGLCERIGFIRETQCKCHDYP